MSGNPIIFGESVKYFAYGHPGSAREISQIFMGKMCIRDSDKTGKEPLEVFEQAMENIMPQLEVKARRVGGATYQVPMEVRPERRETLGLRWLTNYSRLRSEKTMKERLAGEILDAVNGAGGAEMCIRDRYTPAISWWVR